MSEDRRQRLLGLFRAEAKESLAALSAGALDIEQVGGSRETYDAMFRAAHTVKGGARMMALDEIAAVADRAESVVRALRDGEAQPDRGAGQRLLAIVDELTALIWPSETTPGAQTSDAGLQRSEVGPSAGSPPTTADAGGAQAGSGRSPARGAGAAPRAPAALGGVAQADAHGGTALSAEPHRHETVRVPAARIDDVVALAAEARRTAAGGNARALDDLLATTESAALRLRLMPLEGLFADMRRAVRDAAESDGKEARLETHGGDVEADGAVIDAAAEILLQLIRNAVAHGIEPPGERSRAGKAPAGTIRLTVAARGGWLELVVSDDGSGIDEAAVRLSAAERGLAATAPVDLLLFAPGISTRRQADALGGQGVGLDVVRARATAAGGEVSVAWEAGTGTSFSVRLPISLLYERLAVARLGDTPIGIPVDSVEAIAIVGEGLPVDGPVDESSVLTVPLGPLFAPNRLARRAWILSDGRVGIVLDPEAV